MKERHSIDQPQTLSRKERVQLHTRELLQNRHHVAAALARVEELVLQLPRMQTVLTPELRAKFEAQIQMLPKAIQARYMESIESYFSLSASADVVERHLVSEARHTEGLAPPEVLAIVLQEKRTGFPPVGIAHCVREGAYFILSFELASDLEAFYRGTGSKELSAKVGGVYHRALKVPLPSLGSFSISVICVQGLDDTQEGYRRVLVHERQHFIHHEVTDVFSLTESQKKEVTGPVAERQKNMRAIKDELLAYVRDGRSGETIRQALRSPLYANLFEESFPAAELPRVWEIVDQSIAAMQSSALWHSARSILVNHLLSVPLEDFSKWIIALDGFYDARLEELHALDPGQNYPMGLPPSGRIYPPAYRKTAAELSEIQECATRLQADARLFAFGIAKKGDPEEAWVAAKRTMRRMSEEYEEKLQQMRRGTAVVPYAIVHPPSSAKIDRKKMGRIEDRISQDLAQVPQALIDEVYIALWRERPTNGLGFFDRLKPIFQRFADVQLQVEASSVHCAELDRSLVVHFALSSGKTWSRASSSFSFSVSNKALRERELFAEAQRSTK